MGKKVKRDKDYDPIAALFKKRYRKITLEYFGPRCDDYEPECACCKAWVRTDILCEMV